MPQILLLYEPHERMSNAGIAKEMKCAHGKTSTQALSICCLVVPFFKIFNWCKNWKIFYWKFSFWTKYVSIVINIYGLRHENKPWNQDSFWVESEILCVESGLTYFFSLFLTVWSFISICFFQILALLYLWSIYIVCSVVTQIIVLVHGVVGNVVHLYLLLSS